MLSVSNADSSFTDPESRFEVESGSELRSESGSELIRIWIPKPYLDPGSLIKTGSIKIWIRNTEHCMHPCFVDLFFLFYFSVMSGWGRV